jgi:hypothetical protein
MAESPLAAGRRLVAAVILAGAMAPALAVVPPLIIQPNWAELSPQKQQILTPLAGEWNQLESWRKKKWLDIAERYPQMSAEEQQRIQRRMNAWVKLTPDERKAAREKYKNLQQATPEQREALKKMWSEYQTLPEEEKERLKQSAARSTGSKASPKPGVGHPTAKPAAAPVPEPSSAVVQPVPPTTQSTPQAQ